MVIWPLNYICCCLMQHHCTGPLFLHVNEMGKKASDGRFVTNSCFCSTLYLVDRELEMHDRHPQSLRPPPASHSVNCWPDFHRFTKFLNSPVGTDYEMDTKLVSPCTTENQVVLFIDMKLGHLPFDKRHELANGFCSHHVNVLCCHCKSKQNGDANSLVG